MLRDFSTKSHSIKLILHRRNLKIDFQFLNTWTNKDLRLGSEFSSVLNTCLVGRRSVRQTKSIWASEPNHRTCRRHVLQLSISLLYQQHGHEIFLFPRTSKWTVGPRSLLLKGYPRCLVPDYSTRGVRLAIHSISCQG